MVETKKVPNSLQVSLVSPQTPEQVSLRCYIDLKGKRKAWTETRIRQSIEHRLPWRLSRRSPDIPDLVKHCVRSHTEYTRQHQSTDVKVGDNSTTRTLRFGKETADQAIQQGNARPLKPPRYRKGNHGPPSQQKHVLKGTAAMVSNTSKNSRQAINPGCLARNKAFDQHYKAIWLAGISSYLTLESGSRFREKGTETGGILLALDTVGGNSSYLTLESGSRFREKGTETGGILLALDTVGGNSG
ncbi:hypothetical protein R3P38DRAFT_2770884 [Favolaschia claudopus]|uniref:Uncharacterized protein n=1 Tax=Favolaschia claudopus TaxID=2862362 RepID=A0AAW0CIZ2_9AGAR